MRSVQSETRKLYEDFHGADNVADWERTSSAKFSAWRKLVEHLPQGVFVDIGCGDGSVTEKVVSIAGGSCVALDISVEAARKARARNLEHQSGLCDIGRGLPFRDNSIDHVFCSDLLEHLLDVDTFLDEIKRVLKSGGYCVLSTPNLGWLPNRLLLLLGLQPFWVELSYRFDLSGLFASRRRFPAGHIHVFTLRALTSLLRLHGFTIDRTLGARMIERKTLRRWGFPRWLGVLGFAVDSFCALRPSWSAEAVVKFRKP
jgi:ubiquinone/menaquinone biosynthesis C-methylase UbiE